MYQREVAEPEDQAVTLRETITILERLLSVSRRLNSTLEMRPLLLQIVESARDLTNADGASILLMEGEGTLRFAAATGPESGILDGTEVPMQNSLAGWVVRHGEMAVLEDAQADSRVYSIRAIDATQSMIAMPMIFGDRVIGVLESVTTKSRHTFTQQDQETIETLAGVAAVAVENARLFQQSDWVAEVVHEIRTPLTAILSYADLLLRPDLDEQTRERFVVTIQQETERVSSLASQFLDLARLESGRISMARDIIRMDELIDRAVSVIRPNAEQLDRVVHVDVHEPLPPTVGDRARLHQVLLNLLNNAIKYSDPGDTISVGAASDGDTIKVSVTDTGPGIPADQLPQLFQKFHRLRGSELEASGTGLGLVVARQIVEAHRGQIWGESEEDKGSTFYFTLPVIPADTEA